MKSAFPAGTRSIVAVLGARLVRCVIRCVRFILADERQTVTGSRMFGQVGLALARATTEVSDRRIVPLARRSRERLVFFRPRGAAKQVQ